MLLKQKTEGINLLNKLDRLKKGEAPYNDVIRCYIGVFLFFTESVQFGSLKGLSDYFTEMLNLAEIYCPEEKLAIREKEAAIYLKNGFFREAYDKYCELSDEGQFNEDTAYAIRIKSNRALALYGLKRTTHHIVIHRWEDAVEKAQTLEDRKQIEENILLLKKH
ncbi:hypothetical protein [Eubacterium sp. 1001713B170207_170306_E7]|uniref:hypothetical protein n=1 Tax=Eubacterium sp. 1001713B170207_170306_E7 TaxID=2787097 RepID=UPI00189C1AF6|nr:hypothetical protein [Eubacterium sp. 1001713B170207_170306_E7]